MDLMEQRHVNLSNVQVFVLDEADRMLDMGFIQPIRKIAAVLPPATNRQTLMFSATMPKEIMHLADSLLRDPVKVAVTPVSSAVPLIEQALYMVNRHTKPALLEHLLDDEKVSRVVVFTKTKHGADRVSRRLEHAGITSDAIHGNKAQNNRQRALHAFRTGKIRVLVATDVAARGLDVDGITHVINYDLPMEPEAYVHRIGRTGRAGATGIAISFCDHEERGLLRDIERLTGKQVPQLPLPDDMLPATPLPIEERREARAYGSSRGGYGKPPQSGSRRPDGRTQSARADERTGHRGGGGGGHGGGGRNPRPQGGNNPRTPHAAPHSAPHVESKPRAPHAKSGHVQTPGAKGHKPGGMRSWSKPTGGGRGGNRGGGR
jgi:ATP-dependent RNA helicase RhlE